jgi:hypothetical protein
MPEPEPDGRANAPDDADEPDEADDADRSESVDDETRREERAEQLYEEAEEADVDPVTRREALELGLEDEGLSGEGEELGEHIE